MANFRFVLRSGPSAGKEYPLEKNELFIGRDLTNDVVVNDPEVSRRHARLSLQGTGYVIEDLASTNGTSVNNQRLMGPHLLRPGEVVTLGEHTNLVYESLQPVSEATMVAGGMPAAMPENPPAAAPRSPAHREPASQPPAYAGKIPASRPTPIPPPAPKKKSNSGVIILVVILVVIILCACLIIGGLYIVDSTNSWCTFKPILDIFLPGRCP
jgi:predicted component of type VI protein secretion system